MTFAFITAEKAHYPVRTLCRCLAVTRSGYYAWQRRSPAVRHQVDAQLTRRLRVLHADSGQTYGRPRLHRALRAHGVAVSAKRVARLMRAAGLVAKGRRRYRVTTDSAHVYPVAPDRVQRRFTPRTLNRIWAADMTACPTQQGWCYVAVILDLASRRVIGWAVRRRASSPSKPCGWRWHGAGPRCASFITRTAAASMRGTSIADSSLARGSARA